MRDREDGGEGGLARFKGMTAAVTGGANGIGRAVAAGFLAEGANVVVVDLVEPPETLRGPRFDAVVGDVADERIAERTIGTALGRFGDLDVLVNDAAAYPDAALVDIAGRLAAGVRRQRDRRVPDVPGVRAAPHRRGRRRPHRQHLVGLGAGPRPDGAAYAASKAAVETL